MYGKLDELAGQFLQLSIERGGRVSTAYAECADLLAKTVRDLRKENTPVCWRTYYPDTDEETFRAHSESNESCARRIASEIGGYVVPVYHGKPQ